MLRLDVPSYTATSGHRADFNGRVGKPLRPALWDYFLHLDIKYDSPDTFCRNWDALAEYDLEPKHLSGTLSKTADFIADIEDVRDKRRHQIFIVGHIENWESKAIAKMEQFPATSLALSLRGFAGLHLRPSPKFMHEWEKQAIRKMDEFGIRDLTDTAGALAALGIAPSEEFSQRWHARALQFKGQMSIPQITHSLWGWSVIDSIKQSDIAHANAGLMYGQIDDQSELSRTQGRQFRQSCIWFDFPCTVAHVEEGVSSSEMESKIGAAFMKADPGITRNPAPLPLIGHKPDIQVRSDFYIEVDGPTHFVFIPGEAGESEIAGYNGHTQFQNALIRKVAPKATVLRMTYPAADAILDTVPEKTRTDGIHSLLIRARHLHAGIHEVLIKGSPACKLANRLSMIPILVDEIAAHNPLDMASLSGRFNQHGSELAPAHDMDVEMRNFLAAVEAGVGDNAETLRP